MKEMFLNEDEWIPNFRTHFMTPEHIIRNLTGTMDALVLAAVHACGSFQEMQKSAGKRQFITVFENYWLLMQCRVLVLENSMDFSKILWCGREWEKHVDILKN